MISRADRGVTLVELMVTMGIAMILMAAAFPIGKHCIERARASAELAGARSSITAWRAYSADNNNAIIPGYQADEATVNAQGQRVGFPANARYVFRLAPYLDYNLKGTLLVNQQKRINSDYEMSLAPSFGINLTFVGGDYGGGSDLLPTEANFAAYGKFVVTNLNEIHQPSRLIVLASARITDARGRTQPGYNAIKSPRFYSERWDVRFDEKRPYYQFGAVHPRYGGRAICAMADGHVEMINEKDLRDMRRWSNLAAQADDPNWTLQQL